MLIGAWANSAANAGRLGHASGGASIYTPVVGSFHEPTVWCPGFSRSGPPEGGTPNKFLPQSQVHGPNACAKSDRGLSMNLKVGRVSPLRAVCALPNCGAHGVTRPTGSWSLCMRTNEWGLSMNRRCSRHPAGRGNWERLCRREVGITLSPLLH